MRRLHIIAEIHFLDTYHFAFAVMGLMAVIGELFDCFSCLAVHHRKPEIILPLGRAVYGWTAVPTRYA